MVLTGFYDENYGWTEINSNTGEIRTILNLVRNPLLLTAIRDGSEYQFSMDMFRYLDWSTCRTYEIHGNTLTIYHDRGIFELTQEATSALTEAMSGLSVV